MMRSLPPVAYNSKILPSNRDTTMNSSLTEGSLEATNKGSGSVATSNEVVSSESRLRISPDAEASSMELSLKTMPDVKDPGASTGQLASGAMDGVPETAVVWPSASPSLLLESQAMSRNITSNDTRGWLVTSVDQH